MSTNSRDNTALVDPRIADFAENICRSFDKKSPFAFLSEPDDVMQRFAGLHHKTLKYGAIEFAPNQLPDARAALIGSIRQRGHIVSDVGSGRLMSPALKAMYGKDRKTAISMGLAVPRALQLAFLTKSRGDEP